jgi:hypothetical protein
VSVSFLLDGHVRSWSDYLKVHVSHRNLSLLPGLHAGVAAFDWYSQGAAWLGRSMDRREDALDRVRWFVEECDTLQGFQCMAETDSAWAGFAAEVLTSINDEYDRTPVFTVGLEPFRNTRGEPVRSGEAGAVSVCVSVSAASVAYDTIVLRSLCLCLCVWIAVRHCASRRELRIGIGQTQ